MVRPGRGVSATPAVLPMMQVQPWPVVLPGRRFQVERFHDLLCGTGNTHDPAMIQNSYLIDQEPYLKKAPVNPRNKLSTVTVHATNAAALAASTASDAVTNGVGWHYDSTSGNIYAAGFDESIDEWIPAP